ncbi:hypothetical protein OF83DRAFT_1173023 [Amylostereum chailletii]|nr:hypothetical protein OF83DRAFT_1173023 [Amylostereum chailletii]
MVSSRSRRRMQRRKAKKALLAAFGSGTTLQVPENILKLEKELKKEYAVEQEKARKRYEEAEREREKAAREEAAEAKKRHAQIMADVLGEEAKAPTNGPSKKRKAGDDTVKDVPAKRTKAGTKLSGFDTCGSFDIVAPSLAESWPDDAGGELSLKMAPSPGTGRHLWISFDFGVISGVMRCSAPPTTIGTSCSFVWRGREAGENQITFSDLNTGTITFLGDGKLKGTINGDLFGEDNAFVGKLQAKGAKGPEQWKEHVKGWKKEWRGLSERMWNAECSGRWGGGWMDMDGCEEPPADSDTTDGGEREESDGERDGWGSDPDEDVYNVAL